jgi:hypothetical protein
MKSRKVDAQVFYMGRMIDRDSFRTYVYKANEQKLANSYGEYEELISSGLWYATKEDALAAKAADALPVVRRGRKPKDGAISQSVRRGLVSVDKLEQPDSAVTGERPVEGDPVLK